MKFVALFGNGPSWQRGKSVYEQGTAIEGHLESMRDRFDDGSLLLGGPFEEGGGIAVLEACDAAAAARLLEADPAVRAGVLTFELHRLHAYFDAYASVRADMSVAELALSKGKAQFLPTPADSVRRRQPTTRASLTTSCRPRGSGSDRRPLTTPTPPGDTGSSTP